MAIVRIERYTRFTNVPNEAIEDDRLSFRARGILVFLLSKPDHWTARSEQLVSEGKEGRDAIRTALSELETYGYLERRRERADRGRIVTVSIIRDVPETGFQASVDQASVHQSSGTQASTVKTEQQTLSSEEGQKKTSSPSSGRTRSRSRRDAVDDGPDQSKLDEINRGLTPDRVPTTTTTTGRGRHRAPTRHVHRPKRDTAGGLACYWCRAVEKYTKTSDGTALEPREEDIVTTHFKRWLDAGASHRLLRDMVDLFFMDPEMATSTHRWKRFVANAETLRLRVLQRPAQTKTDEELEAGFVTKLPEAVRREIEREAEGVA